VCLCICLLILTFILTFFLWYRRSERYIQLHRVITKRNFIFYYIWQIIMIDDSILFWHVYNINVNLKSFVPFCWIADIFLLYIFLFIIIGVEGKIVQCKKEIPVGNYLCESCYSYKTASHYAWTTFNTSGLYRPI